MDEGQAGSDFEDRVIIASDSIWFILYGPHCFILEPTKQMALAKASGLVFAFFFKRLPRFVGIELSIDIN